MRVFLSSTLIMGASALAIALQGCSDSMVEVLDRLGDSGPQDAIAAGDPAVPPPTAQPYGVDGTLNEAELVALQYLQFPQSYDAIQERFGFPARRDEVADYYQIKGTQHWVKVEYSGDVATGYRFSD